MFVPLWGLRNLLLGLSFQSCFANISPEAVIPVIGLFYCDHDSAFVFKYSTDDDCCHQGGNHEKYWVDNLEMRKGKRFHLMTS